MEANNTPSTQQTPQVNPSVVKSVEKSGGNEQSSSSNKMGLWLVVGLIVIAVIGGAYWYLNKQANPAENTETPNTNQEPKTESSLDQDLDAIQVEATDSGLDTVDNDIKNL